MGYIDRLSISLTTLGIQINVLNHFTKREHGRIYDINKTWNVQANPLIISETDFSYERNDYREVW